MAERRVALVTGASRGIGRCAALALARRGFDVVITARTVHEGDGRAHSSSALVPDVPVPIAGSLDATADAVEQMGRTCVPVPMDLMDRASVERTAEVALGTMGRVDVLVNNAIYQGPGTMDRLLDLPLELAERCLVGDYLHPLLLTQLVLPQMLERGEVLARFPLPTLDAAFLEDSRENRRLENAESDIEPNPDHDDREPEWDSPAPAEELVA